MCVCVLGRIWSSTLYHVYFTMKHTSHSTELGKTSAVGDLASWGVDVSTFTFDFLSCINHRRSHDYATLTVKGCGIWEIWGKSQPYHVLDMCLQENCPNPLNHCTLICRWGSHILTSLGCWQECAGQKLSGCHLACTTYHIQKMAVNSYMLYSFVKTSTEVFSSSHLIPTTTYVVDIFSIAFLYIL